MMQKKEDDFKILLGLHIGKNHGPFLVSDELLV
jgi:hypothetical protein